MKFFIPAETIEKVVIATNRILPPNIECLFIFREHDGDESLVCADLDKDPQELADILRHAADDIEGREEDYNSEVD